MDTSTLLVCTDASLETGGIFDLSLAPDLLFYSYVPIIFISLLIGSFVLIKNRFSLLSKALFLMTVLFSIFIANEIIQWIVIPAGIMHFAWTLSLLLHFLIVVTSLYFAYLFVKKRNISFRTNVLFALVSLPVIILLPTKLSVIGFDIDWCGGINGPLWYYLYAIECIAIILCIISAVRVYISYVKKPSADLLSSVFLLIGTATFLIVFFGSYFFGEMTGLYEINLIGPTGMLVFVGILSYMIVKFKLFNIRLIGAQALMLTLWFLIGSIMFVAHSRITSIVAGFTLFASVVLGLMLIRSINETVKQKDEIEKLAQNLQKANDQLKILDKMKSEFVSIASHQLRSPLTAIRGYTSMLLEGSFGKLNARATEAIERIADSSRFMALSVEDYLNVSRIEAGNMRYEMSDFNLKTETEHIVDELRPTALKKGLLLTFKSDCESGAFIHADIGKTRQVLQNLIDNSIKYTLRGTITVKIHDDIKKKRIYATISDTGVGMSKQTQEDVFEKFVRAKNANHVNVTGTGLGLFVAKKMVEEMGGKIKATSEGEGKGSSFIVEWKLVGNSVRGA